MTGTLLVEHVLKFKSLLQAPFDFLGVVATQGSTDFRSGRLACEFEEITTGPKTLFPRHLEGLLHFSQQNGGSLWERRGTAA